MSFSFFINPGINVYPDRFSSWKLTKPGSGWQSVYYQHYSILLAEVYMSTFHFRWSGLLRSRTFFGIFFCRPLQSFVVIMFVVTQLFTSSPTRQRILLFLKPCGRCWRVKLDVMKWQGKRQFLSSKNPMQFQSEAKFQTFLVIMSFIA